MTKLTKEELKENLDTISQFIVIEHGEEWHEYCKKNRNGKQELEQVSTLISLMQENHQVILGKRKQENGNIIFTNCKIIE